MLVFMPVTLILVMLVQVALSAVLPPTLLIVSIMLFYLSGIIQPIGLLKIHGGLTGAIMGSATSRKLLEMIAISGNM